jgi:hypothetical protein
MSEILCINNFENEEKKMEDKNVGLKKLYLNKKHIKEEETKILEINELLNLLDENNLKIKNYEKINLNNEYNKYNKIKINSSNSESFFSDDTKSKNDISNNNEHLSIDNLDKYLSNNVITINNKQNLIKKSINENSFKLIKNENSNQSYNNNNENQGNEINIKYNNNYSINSSFSFHFGNSEKSKLSINNIDFSDSVPQENQNLIDFINQQNSFQNNNVTMMSTKMDTEDNLKNSFMIL